MDYLSGSFIKNWYNERKGDPFEFLGRNGYFDWADLIIDTSNFKTQVSLVKYQMNE